MKTQFCLFFITTVLLASQARGDGLAMNQWGAVTNGVQMSIALDGGDREIKTNDQVQLLVQIKNIGSLIARSSLILGRNTDPGSGLRCVVISPSGKDISPTAHSYGPSGAILNLSPGQGDSFTFDLGRICKFDEVGNYKITAQKIVYTDDGKNITRSWTVVSNPLLVKVVPAK